MYTRLLTIAFHALGVAVFSHAIIAAPSEPIFPGGATPRVDIRWVADFEDFDNCVMGNEPQCWVDNGFPEGSGSETNSFYFRQDPSRSAVGSGYLHGFGMPGSSGPGYTDYSLGDSYDRVNLRFYVRYGERFMDYIDAPSGPSVSAESLDQSPRRNITVALAPKQLILYATRDASPPLSGSFDLYVNQPNPPVLKNGRWYCIELAVEIDTQVSLPSNNLTHSGNGTARLWIDGQLVLEYTDINWGGAQSGLRFVGGFGPRCYYHATVPPFGTSIDFDNMIAATNGYIGPAAVENQCH